VIIKVASKCPTQTSNFTLQQIDAKNTCLLHLHWVLFAGNIKWSVRIFIQPLGGYFTDIDFFNPILKHHDKQCFISRVPPSMATSLNALCTITADSIGDDMALLEINSL
jgi:hypothetical protein